MINPPKAIFLVLPAELQGRETFSYEDVKAHEVTEEQLKQQMTGSGHCVVTSHSTIAYQCGPPPGSPPGTPTVTKYGNCDIYTESDTGAACYTRCEASTVVCAR